MNCDELVHCFTTRWPRPSELSNRQYEHMSRDFGVQFAGIPLDEVTREAARAYANAHPSRTRFLRAIFNDAIRDGLCEENPFASLGVSAPKRTLVMPTTQELEMLLRAATEPLRGRIGFAAYTGLRRGELLHLRPQDFEKGRVHVEWQINANGEKAHIKGRIKDRWAVVPEPARRAIASILLATEPNERLWPVSPRRHDKQWRKVRDETRLTHLRFHDLRHFAASWFLDHGASFHDVGVQLGHCDNGKEVRETYGHLSRGKALDRLEELISGG